MGGQPGGNRQDNRQRGNAAQLLEKYKSMARDAQLAGDRVQTEYYLQYADHYYRVLGESRARFEEQRRQRGNDLDDDEGGDEEMMEGGDEQGGEDERPERQPRRERFERNDRPDRGDRPERSERSERSERPRRYAREDRDEGDRESRADANGESIALDVLPPAIGAPVDAEAAADEAPRPRRRTRRPRADDGGETEIAPAA